MEKQLRKQEISELVDTALDNVISEMQDVKLQTQAKSTPSGSFEKAWIPGSNVKSSGTSKQVALEIPAGDVHSGDDWVMHTHPAGHLPIPSFQDLISAVKAKALGFKGSAIIADKEYTSIEPTDRIMHMIGPIENGDNVDRKIMSKLAGLKNNLEGMPEEVFKKLVKAGFNVDSSLLKK